MKEKCRCDKCGSERECDVDEFVCISEGIEENEENGKIKETNTVKYLTSVTCRICGRCLNKRKIRFLLFALLAALGSLPFFISGQLFEFGFIFIVFAVTVALLSTGGHEKEYAARMHYKKWREENNELILHPKMVSKTVWSEILKNGSSGKFKIISNGE